MSGTHQGYTNYETFSVGVTLLNDRKHYDRWLSEARGRLQYAKDQEPAGDAETVRECAVEALAVDFRYWGDELVEPALDGAPELFSSAFRAGYQEIDWLDIAREWVVLAEELDQ